MATPAQQMNGDRASAYVEGENELLKELSDLVAFTREERTSIVEAGVPEVENHLYETMEHSSQSKDGNPAVWHEHKYPSDGKLYGKDIGHLMDNITHKPGQLYSGGTFVGFTKGAAPLAQWTNWGTFRQPGWNYFERAWNSLETENVFKPQGVKAEQILKSKSHGLIK